MRQKFGNYALSALRTCASAMRLKTNNLQFVRSMQQKPFFAFKEPNNMTLRCPYANVPLVNESLHDFILKEFPKYGGQTAIVEAETGKRYSFLETMNVCNAVTTEFFDAGLRKGDLVALYLPNCPEFIFSVFGALPLGATLALLNPAYPSDELQYYIRDSECKFFITNSENYAKAREAASKLGDQNKIVKWYVIGSNAQCAGSRSFDDVMKRTRTRNVPLPKINPVEDVSFLPYSSGTTGNPKGVMITHFSNVNQIIACTIPELTIRLTRGDAFLGVLPFFHIFGLVMMLMALKTGAYVVCMRKFDSKLFLKSIQDHKVRVLCVVPPIALLMAKDRLVDDYNLSSLEHVVSGAAPVGRELSEEFLDRFPNMKTFIQGYGMTEVGCAAAVSPNVSSRSELRHGSIGKPIPHFEIKIVDLESGRTLGPNENGEIYMRSPTNMKGYFKNAKATSETIDRDGWLHTGDIGHYDAYGYIYIVDRIKELIKVKGFQVAPSELEDLLLSHPEISDACVIGRPDAALGETPVAFVVRNEKSKISPKDVINFFKGRVAKYKELSDVIFVESLPKSASGKLLRRFLREQLKATSKSKL